MTVRALFSMGINVLGGIYKTYYTSQREIWGDISRAEGE